MKLKLEATPDELFEKGYALLEELYETFSGAHPELADRLEKALPRKEQELKFPMLRGLNASTTAEYDAMLKRMLAAIGKVLDQTTQGSSVLSKAAGVPPPEPPDKDEEEESGEAEEPLEPGDYDPDADEIVPEPEEKEETEKSMNADPVHDFTKPIADKDSRAYERVKSALKNKGYLDSDFEEGGPFYGYSVNQLIELMRGKAE